MNARTRGKIEMAGRGQEFSRKDPINTQAHSPLVARLTHHLTLPPPATLSQGQSGIAARAASKRRLTLRRAIRERLHYIGAVGATVDGFQEFRVPKLHSAGFESQARVELNRARAFEAKLRENGLSDGVFDDIE